jgi:hypothetical protein
MSKLCLFFSGALLFALARTAELSKVQYYDLTPSFQPFDLYESLNNQEESDDSSPHTFLGQSKHSYKCKFLTDLNFYNLTPLAD